MAIGGRSGPLFFFATKDENYSKNYDAIFGKKPKKRRKKKNTQTSGKKPSKSDLPNNEQPLNNT